MRMWAVNPRRMCNKHLVAEHYEMHMFAGSMKRKIDLTGYVTNNLLAPRKVKARHDALAEEMVRRDLNHKSPMDKSPDAEYLPEHIKKAIMLISESEEELYTRCKQCATINDEYIKQCSRKGKLEDLI